MKRKLLFNIFCTLFSISGAFAQNAPVSSLPVKTGCPGSVVSIPVTVTGFSNIGSVSLTFKYNPAVLTFVSASNTAGFPGLVFGYGIPGKVVISGFSTNAITYGDNAVLCTFTFNYLGGTSALTWYDTGSTCEFTDFPNYNTLNDIPYANFYLNGQVGPTLDVNFTADALFPAINQVVAFSDLTTGDPTSWNWAITPESFNYLNGTNPASQNPQVQFTQNGPYKVALSATKGTCTITKTIDNFIHCGINGLWTGLISTDWNTPANWHNYIIPDVSTNVIIPATPLNWPVYAGDLIIGAQINSLTLQGAASTMTVNGDLFILPAKYPEK